MGEIARRFPGARSVREILKKLFLAERHCRDDFVAMERVMAEFNAASSERTPRPRALAPITKLYGIRNHDALPPELRGGA